MANCIKALCLTLAFSEIFLDKKYIIKPHSRQAKIIKLIARYKYSFDLSLFLIIVSLNGSEYKPLIKLLQKIGGD